MKHYIVILVVLYIIDEVTKNIFIMIGIYEYFGLEPATWIHYFTLPILAFWIYKNHFE